MRTDIAQDNDLAVHLQGDAKRLAGTGFPEALLPLHSLYTKAGMSQVGKQRPEGFLDKFLIASDLLLS